MAGKKAKQAKSKKDLGFDRQGRIEVQPVETILRVTPPQSVLPLGKSLPSEPERPKRVALPSKLTSEDQQKAAAVYYTHAHLFGA